MNLFRKILLFVVLPFLLAVIGIGTIISNKSAELSKQQSAHLEQSLIDAKKAELRYYTAFAKNSISSIYHSSGPDNQAAKEQVKALLRAISYGPDGYFFVYDFDGKSIVHPRQHYRVGKNWIKLKDKKGNFVIQDLINAAQKGGGYTKYYWEQPSTGKLREKIGYAIALENWGWMLGTGMYIDDVTAQARALEKTIAKKTTQTFLLIMIITAAALAIIGAAGIFFIVQQHRTARSQLKQQNQRIVEAQELERTRVARELHDGISQQLSSTKYIFELAQIQQSRHQPTALPTIDKGINSLAGAISEVRRISRDLRPGLLDDLGLAPAIKALGSEFGERAGLDVTVTTTPVKDMLSDKAKTACFRVAQEALNNISRHANATHVSINLSVNQNVVTLAITDNGDGFSPQTQRQLNTSGMGLNNMRERITHHRGHFSIKSDKTGTTVKAILPTISQTDLSIAAE